MAGSEVTKYFLFLALNIILGSCGAILLAFGAILQVDEHKGVRSFNHLSIGGFGIGVGVLGLLISSWGIYGLFKRKSSVLKWYAILILMLLLVQIVLGAIALGLSNNQDNDEELQKDVERLFSKIDDDSSVKRINHLQKTYHCCGTTGPTFYRRIYNKPIPPSCCSTLSDEQCTNPYERGCAKVYAHTISKNVNVIGGVAVGFSPILLVAAGLGWIIGAGLKNKCDFGQLY